MERIEESAEFATEVTTTSIIDSYLFSEPSTTKTKREIPDQKNKKKLSAKPSYVQQSKHHSFEPWANSAGSGIKHNMNTGVNLAVVSETEQPNNINSVTTSSDHISAESRQSYEYSRTPATASKSNRPYQRLVPLTEISQEKNKFNASQGSKYLEVPKAVKVPVNVRSSRFGHSSIDMSKLGNRLSTNSRDTSATLVDNETSYANTDEHVCNNEVATPHSIGTAYKMPPLPSHTPPTPTENVSYNKKPYTNVVNNAPQHYSINANPIPTTQEHSLIPHTRNEDNAINTELQLYPFRRRPLSEIYEESPAYQDDSVAVDDLENPANTLSGQKSSIEIPIPEVPMTRNENEKPRRSIFGWFKSLTEEKPHYGIAIPMQAPTSPDTRYGASADPNEYGARYQPKSSSELRSNIYPIYSYVHNVNDAKGRKPNDQKSGHMLTTYTNGKGFYNKTPSIDSDKKSMLIHSLVSTKPRKSYPVRALLRKSLVYQKRQWVVNFFCVTLCPILMVAIAGLMAMIVTALVLKNNPAVVKSVDPRNVSFEQNYDDLTSTPASEVPNVSGKFATVKHANFYIPLVNFEFFTVPDAADDCVIWTGPDYPLRDPYETDPNVNVSLRLDSTFRPEPQGGWLSFANPQNMVALAKYQTYQNLFVIEDFGVNAGDKPLKSPLILSQSQSLNALTTFASQANDGDSGVLGSIPTKFFANITNLGGPTSYQAESLVPSVAQLNIPPLVGQEDAALIDNQPQLALKLAQATTNLPWGGLIFNNLNPTSKVWSYIMQIGHDDRIAQRLPFLGYGLRRVIQQSQLSTAFLLSTNVNAIITAGFRVMPYLWVSEMNVGASALLGRVLYPFGVSFLLPAFVITLVKEKENRILVMMRMNGLKDYAYYMTHYIHFYILHTINSVFFVASGMAFKMEFFSRTSPYVLCLLFMIWGHMQIILAFLFSVIFNNTRTALVVSCVTVISGVVINLASEAIFTTANIAYLTWPPFAFYRALSIVNEASFDPSGDGYTMARIRPGDQLFMATVAMIAGYFVLLLVTWYLSQVLPSDYDEGKPWHFVFSTLFKKMSGTSETKADRRQSFLESGLWRIDPEDVRSEDDDVREERRRVLENQFLLDSPLVLKRIRKEYPNGKLAVKDVTFAVESNMVFGLLGPNGAGKTTLLSILTGLYPATKGDAILNGFDVKTQRDQVYMSIGICPQHDILWDDLTVCEHLLFYARLKGVPSSQEHAKVLELLERVRLVPFKDRLTRGLSGGEKRRLSIAIALVGDPTVVFLDEPTTGLDPEVRRLIWNIISEAKTGRTIMLTTHSMEEAEVLCQRVSIMTQGTLRCIGPQLRLKEKYGRGFKLSFSGRTANMETAIGFIESLLPPTARRLPSYTTNVTYEFSPEPGLISRLFKRIESEKKYYGVDDWGLSQTTLEEVFLKIIGKDGADAE
ncbi:4879_t:CDS:2 [Paraglomus occultum]|uniref:4879_t:CDS:1 n=1 Tax=Paraglomus occultum TaxID=144539 RepID=A0A9N9B436_9GLOM|nr:4879_t:CDS:2 [Paraglomus occultum]